MASVVTQQEASLAPPEVVRLFAQTFPDNSTLLSLTDRAEELARAYVQAGVLTAKYIDDARHVAIATTHGISLIVSWNFKHLANYQRESGFNRINLVYGLARETEGMTRDEVVAYFDRDAVSRRFLSALERSGQQVASSASKA